MKVRNIMMIAIRELGLQNEMKEKKALTLQDRTVRILLRCINNEFSRMARTYLLLSTNEKLVPKNQIIKYQSFSQRVINIINVTHDNEIVEYEVLPNYLRVASQDVVTVTYNYISEPLGLNDNIILPALLSSQTLAYAAAQEYKRIK